MGSNAGNAGNKFLLPRKPLILKGFRPLEEESNKVTIIYIYIAHMHPRVRMRI
jgi:hypothetical protein